MAKQTHLTDFTKPPVNIVLTWHALCDINFPVSGQSVSQLLKSLCELKMRMQLLKVSS